MCLYLKLRKFTYLTFESFSVIQFWTSFSLDLVMDLTEYYNTFSIQFGWSPATTLAKSPTPIKPNQPLPYSHCSSPRHSCLLLSLQNSNSSIRRLSTLGHLCNMWNMVWLFLDSRPVPQMEPNTSRNLPWPLVHPLRAWGWAKPVGPSRCICEYCGPA